MNNKIEVAEKADHQEIVEVWEASVRATHDFLTEADIQHFKPLILNEYLGMVDLFCMRNDASQIVAFLGVADGKIEMLFIHPDWRGQGIGRVLAEYAIRQLAVSEVDVNEQNEQAVGFYKHIGFKVIS